MSLKSTISNTILDADGNAIANVPVNITLMPTGGFRIDDQTEVATLYSTTTNASGFWSAALEQQANITPTGSWYQVDELVPAANGGTRTYFISVGASPQTLLASLVTPSQTQPTVVPAGTVYISQASGDARYQQLGSLSSATPGTEVANGAGTAGVSPSASRADHIHPAPTATPVSIGSANAAGVASTFAASDHVHGYSPPACRVFNSAAISIPNSTTTALTFDSERYDPTGMHSTVTNTSRITISTAGLYLVTGHVAFAGNATGFRWIAVSLNGTTTLLAMHNQLSVTAADQALFSVSTVWKFSPGDFIQLLVNQTSGGALNVNSAADYSPEFSATWIGVG